MGLARVQRRRGPEVALGYVSPLHPQGRDEQHVRSFSSFTTGLLELASWLEHCGVKTVAMDSTGVYWIPLFELLSH